MEITAERPADLTGPRTDWSITHACVPQDLGSPEAWAVHGAARAGRETYLDLFGTADLAPTAADLAANLRNQRYSTKVLLVATRARTASRAEDVAGAVTVVLPDRSNTRTAFLTLWVRPAARRSGVGTALVAAAEVVARDHGRTTLIVESEHRGEPAEDEPHLEPPTGSGRIRPDAPAVRLALAHGYRLEQADRYSVLDLPVPATLLARLHDDAVAHAGSTYRTHTWTDAAPDRWLADLAVLWTRMSTDAPTAGLDIEEDPYDGERIRTYEAVLAEGGLGRLTVAAEHVPTGKLVAFTILELPHDRPEVAYQEDTLVLSEHRGRRLGMLVKTEALRRLRDVRPLAARVHTWNAEENAHMLAINVALGFRPAGVVGTWQKTTTRTRRGTPA